MSHTKITIIGSGLVGSLLSIYLAKRGFKIQVYERRQDARKTNIYAGRSINLALSDRGWRALEKTGISKEVLKIAIPMFGRQLHAVNGEQTFQNYGKKEQAIFSVSRGTLNMKLLDLADAYDNVDLFFEHRVTNVDINNASCTVEHNDSKFEVKSDLVICTDGAYSVGRLGYQLGIDKFNYEQFFIDCGYKELTIPAAANGNFLIEKQALHIWPRGKYMMIALPNLDGSFTCTLFFPFTGDPSFDSLQTREQVSAFFNNQFADAVKLMPNLVDEYLANPTSSLVTVKCFPWVINNSVALMGDAAHAIVPFFGQGMNCGFEDVRIFDELIEKHQTDWPKILAEYQQLRKPDADAIAQLALNNFIEMRDLVANPKFQLQKKIEALVYQNYPDKWIPAYSLVTFSADVRYSEALRKGQEQQRIMDEFMADENNIANYEKPDYFKKIIDKIL